MLPADNDTKLIDPGQTFQSLFQLPVEVVTLDRDFELGGVAIQDPTQGLQIKIWEARIVNSSFIYILDTEGVYEAPWYESPTKNLSEVSLTFDQNMRPVIAFVEGQEAKLFYYDTLTEENIVANFGSGIVSPRVSLDEKRQFYGQVSDVIFSYIRAGNLYIRLQRDRYEVEYLVHEGVPEGYYIQKSGMTTGYRFQWRFVKPAAQEEILSELVTRAPTASSNVIPPYQVSGTTATTFDSGSSTIYRPDNEESQE